MVAPDRHGLSPSIFKKRLPSVSEDSVGCALLERDGRVVSLTKTFATMIGCNVQMLFGQSIFNLLDSYEPGLLLREGVRNRVVARANGRQLCWTIHRTATGAALGGYYIGLLAKQNSGEENNPLQADHLAELGRGTAVVAHEIANSLSIISDNAELLLEGNQVKEESRESLELVRDQAHRLGLLLNDVLNFSRDLPLKIASHDCVKLVEGVVQLCNQRRILKNVKLRIIVEGQLPPVAADADRLYQVFFNVIKNACDASVDGDEVLINIRRGSLRQNQPAVTVDIIDHGVGVDPANLKRIFEPFFSTKAAGEGTGLGLPIARRIVVAHGGELQVTSEPGKGSQASIMLPVFKSSSNSRANRRG